MQEPQSDQCTALIPAEQFEDEIHLNVAPGSHGQVNVQQNIHTALSLITNIVTPTFYFHSCTVDINYGTSNPQ